MEMSSNLNDYGADSTLGEVRRSLERVQSVAANTRIELTACLKDRNAIEDCSSEIPEVPCAPW